MKLQTFYEVRMKAKEGWHETLRYKTLEEAQKAKEKFKTKSFFQVSIYKVETKEEKINQ